MKYNIQNQIQNNIHLLKKGYWQAQETSLPQRFSFVAVLLTLGVFSFLGCTKSVDRAGIDPTPERKASAYLSESFTVKTLSEKTFDESIPKASIFGYNKAQVSIQKSALEKEFLLTTNMLTQSPTPSFSALQSRIVYFKQKENQLIMVESSTGRSVGQNNISQTLLIAAFPITSSDDSSISFDFNAGMSKLISVGDMYSSDDESAASGFDYELPVADLNLSYLDSATIQDNSLQIHQIAQVSQKDSHGQKISPLEIRYTLAPYLPDPNFVPVKSPDFDKVGFFEANPLLLPDGSTRIYSMKWNERKPIVFAISANTPNQYRDLVKSAVLYWNKVLGPDKVQVIQLTDTSVTAPNDKYNIIQWVDWESAGFAYADAHIDPRSGEITHAQVFFPTAFINSNVEKRVRLFEGAQKHTAFGLQGFKSARLCKRNVFKDLSTATLTNPEITKEAMDKAMRDYVYEVIAHEVGHLMGLRHNFAGSLYGNYDTADRAKLGLEYYKNMKAPAGIKVTSSVMEYSRFEESSWDGDMLNRPESTALPYDKAALRVLYFQEKIPSDIPAFCTDSDLNKYVDCNMHDEGQSIVSHTRDIFQYNLKSLPMRVLNTYIAKTKIPDLQQQSLISVSEVSLNPAAQAISFASDYFKLMSLFKSGAHFIKTRQFYVPVHEVDEIEVNKKEIADLANEVQRLGGMKSLLVQIPDDLDQTLINQFESLLSDDRYATGGSLGQSYSFTESEKQTMRIEFKKFATLFKKQLTLQVLSALAGTPTDFKSSYGQEKPTIGTAWIDHTITDNLSDILLDRFNHYVLGFDEKFKVQVVAKNGFQKEIELPLYKFDQEIRTQAATIFSNEAIGVDWAYSQKNEASDKLDSDLSLLGDLSSLDVSKLSREALRWSLNNQQVKNKMK